VKEKVAAPVYKTEITAVGIRCADHETPSICKELVLTSPTSGGRSVDIVSSRTQATKFSFIHLTDHASLSSQRLATSRQQTPQTLRNRSLSCPVGEATGDVSSLAAWNIKPRTAFVHVLRVITNLVYD
jgi:hypothetical protein